MEETFGLLQLFRRRLPIPVVVRLHGPCFANAAASEITFDGAYRRRVEQEGVTISLADAISASSADILERTRTHYGLNLDGASVIPPPAPVVPIQDRWRLEGCDRSRILFLGRFDRHKGGDVVIDCVRILTRKLPAPSPVVCGTRCGLFGRVRAILVSGRISRRNGRRKSPASVDWLGRQPDAAVAALRRQAFLTIVASRYRNLRTGGAGGHGPWLSAGRHAHRRHRGDRDRWRQRPVVRAGRPGRHGRPGCPTARRSLPGGQTGRVAPEKMP